MFLNEIENDNDRDFLIKCHLEVYGGPEGGKVGYLSQGKFGKIYLIKYDYTNSRVAKCPHFKSFEDKTQLKLHFEKAFHELEVTNRLRSNPWFNTFFDITFCHDWPFFISRLWDGTLSDLIAEPNRWNFDDKLQVALLIVRGLITAQKEGIFAHQDLKPQNIFINNLSGKFVGYDGDEGIKYSVKIGDLGMGNAFYVFGKNSASRPYQAPEQYKNELMDVCSAKKMDVFALGVLLHEILTDGYHPLGIKTADYWPIPLNGEQKWTRETIWKVWAKKAEKSLELLPSQVSKSLKGEIQKMLSPRASDRPDLETVFDCIYENITQRNFARCKNIRIQMEYFESPIEQAENNSMSDWPYLDKKMQNAREFYRDL